MWRRLIYHPEINYALRQTLVLCLPVLFGLLIGQLQLGLMFSLVPACCNIAGLDTPHKRFFKRLIVGGSLFAFSGVLLQQALLWHVPLPALMLGLALLLGVTGEISPLHARLLPAALVAAIFALSTAGTVPIWQAPLLYAIGTAWYGLFTWFWFKLWKEQPMRETLSQLYLELADYFEAKYSLLTQHTDPQTALPPLLVRQQKVMDLISLLYQQLNFLPHTNNLESACSAPFRWRWTCRSTSPSACICRKRCKTGGAEPGRSDHSPQCSGDRRPAARGGARYSLPSTFEALLHDPRAGGAGKMAAQHPDNPVGQFCYYHFSRIARLLRTQHPLYRRDLMPGQHRLPFWPALLSYLSFKSTALRNAARLGVTLAVGSSLGAVFNLPKPYWILLTIMLVSQNGYKPGCVFSTVRWARLPGYCWRPGCCSCSCRREKR